MNKFVMLTDGEISFVSRESGKPCCDTCKGELIPMKSFPSDLRCGFPDCPKFLLYRAGGT